MQALPMVMVRHGMAATDLGTQATVTSCRCLCSTAMAIMAVGMATTTGIANVIILHGGTIIAAIATGVIATPIVIAAINAVLTGSATAIAILTAVVGTSVQVIVG